MSRYKNIKEKAENNKVFIFVMVVISIILVTANALDGFTKIKKWFCPEKEYIEIEGVVSNQSGNPLKDVLISMPNLIQDTSNNTGHFFFKLEKQKGNKTTEVIFSKPGFEELRREVGLDRNKNLGEVKLIQISKNEVKIKEVDTSELSIPFLRPVIYEDDRIKKLFSEDPILSSNVNPSKPIIFNCSGEIVPNSTSRNIKLYYFTGGNLQLMLGEKECYTFSNIPIEDTDKRGNQKLAIENHINAEIEKGIMQNLLLIKEKIKECLES